MYFAPPGLIEPLSMTELLVDEGFCLTLSFYTGGGQRTVCPLPKHRFTLLAPPPVSHTKPFEVRSDLR